MSLGEILGVLSQRRIVPILEDDVVAVIGSRIEFEVALIDDETGRPFDLTSYDQYRISLKASNSAVLTITQDLGANDSQLTLVGNAVLGVIKAVISPIDSAMLKTGENQDIDLEFSQSGDSTAIERVKMDNRLSILSTSLI